MIDTIIFDFRNPLSFLEKNDEALRIVDRIFIKYDGTGVYDLIATYLFATEDYVKKDLENLLFAAVTKKEFDFLKEFNK